jgi:tetratricopeptide (TPR) repeat protein
MILYALALFSKTTACTLPAALVLAAWIKKEPLDRRRRLQIASFLAVGVAMGLLTVWWERNVQKTSGHQFQLTKPEALIVAGRALWFYAGKLLWPSGLTFSYPRWPVGGDWRLWLWPASALAAAAGLAESWRRGRRAPAIAFLFFASALSPLLGFIPLYTFQYAFAADHYQYVASMGLIALFAAAAALKLAPSEPSVPRAHPAALLLLAVLGVLTWNRASAFAGAEPLWRDTLRKNPASWMSYENLACVLIEQKRLPEAETLLKTSLALKPDEFRTHYDLGFLYDLERRAPEALAEYEEALRLEPRHLNSRYKLAHLLSSLGRDEEASAQYRQALATDPDNAQTRYAFGLLLSRRNRLDDAVAQYREAVRLDPRYYPAHNNLGNALQRLNRPDEALAEYRTALAIEPGFPEAHFNLALMLEKAGRLEEAAAEYSVALQLKQDFAAARQRLNAVRAGLLRSGRPLPGI